MGPSHGESAGRVRKDDAEDRADDGRPVLGRRDRAEGGERESRGRARAGETRQAGPDGVAAGVAAAAGRRAAAIEEVEADHRESQPRGADAVVQAPDQREASVHGDEGGARGEEREEGPREEESDRRDDRLRRGDEHAQTGRAVDRGREGDAREGSEGDVADPEAGVASAPGELHGADNLFPRAGGGQRGAARATRGAHEVAREVEVTRRDGRRAARRVASRRTDDAKTIANQPNQPIRQ
mmetsp:Transcript_1626/g.5387  ORF Transcript_1626/g.5387 Transcript_1626/m.5387 type:complete len:240 (-) Transcript_1626:226-945(-)